MSSNRGRFWGADDSDDDDDRDEDGSLDDGAGGAAGGGRVGVDAKSKAARFVDLDSDSESDDEKRVVRTAKDKKWDAMLSIIASMNKQLRVNNWQEVEDGFERLNRALRDASSVIVKEGIPRFYIRTLMELEDAVNGMTRAASKEMSKTGAKALNRMKMTLKKNNPTYAAAIEAYRKDPDAVEKDENEVRREAKKAAHSSAKAAAAGGADDSDEDEVVIGRMGVQVKKKVIVDEDEDDDDDDDDIDDDDEDDEEEEEDEDNDEIDTANKDEEVDDDDDDDEFDDDDDDDEDDDEEDEAYKGLTGRAKWVKREIVGKSKDEKMAEKDSRRADQDAKLRAKKERAAKKEEELAKTGTGVSASTSAAATTVVDLAQLESKSFDIEAAVQAKKWSRTMLEEEVQRVLAMRGRKGADTKALVAYLGALANKSLVFGPHVAIPTIVQAIGARFSLSASRLDAFLDRSSWKRSLRDVSTVLSIFEANPELRLGHVTSEDLAELMSKKSNKKGGMLGKAVLVSNGPESSDSAVAIGDSTTGQQGGDDFVAAPTKRRTAASAIAAAAAAAANEVESAAQAAAIARAEAELADPNVVRIVGDLSVLINGLQDEYIKSLQNMDPHKQDYVLRISDESALTQIAERAFVWYSRKASEQADRDAAHNTVAPPTSKGSPVVEKSEQLQTLEAGATRLACLRIEHMYYKHDSIAYMLRVAAATADKRAEVASLAAAAAMQALEEARRAAVEAGRTSAQASSSTSSTTSSSAAANPTTPTSPRAGDVMAAASAAAAAGKDAQEAASKAVSAAANAYVVGESAALLAIASAKARGKKGFASAAGVVAKAVVVELSRREGGLLSGAAVETSRSVADMETLADIEAAKALADAESAGIDLGELRMVPVANGAPGEVVGVPVIDSQATIASLAHYIYRRGDSRTKNKAVLCHVFHHALHDRFHAARDLLVMSRCQDSIASMQQEARLQPENVRVQILYNRALAMLGICAFRCGLYDQSHECLSEICGSGHTKELLAQGLIMFRHGQAAERDAETEREERRRLVPYHMHINVELADACHLTSAVLLEVPNIAAAEFDPKRREISKCFRKYLDILDSKSFVGPPETTRDSIMLAALALAEGEWKRASELITSLKVWHLWGSGRGHEQIKFRLVQAIKEAGLVTFLHSYSQFYESLSRDSLCEMFELSASSVQGIVSKLMYSGEIEAKWDQPTSTIVVLRSPPSKLQALALDFANHVASLADANEMLLHNRSGLGLERGPNSGDRAPGNERRGGGGGGDGQYRRSRGNLSGGRGGGGRSSTFVEGRGNGGFGRGGGRGGNFASGRREFKQRGF